MIHDMIRGRRKEKGARGGLVCVHLSVCACASVCVCICVRVHLCACASVCVCICVCMCVRALTWSAVSLLHPDVAVALGDAGLGV